MSKIIIGFISLSALLFTACGQVGSNKDEATQHSQATPESHGHSTVSYTHLTLPTTPYV